MLERPLFLAGSMNDEIRKSNSIAMAELVNNQSVHVSERLEAFGGQIQLEWIDQLIGSWTTQVVNSGNETVSASDVSEGFKARIGSSLLRRPPIDFHCKK